MVSLHTSDTQLCFFMAMYIYIVYILVYLGVYNIKIYLYGHLVFTGSVSV